MRHPALAACLLAGALLLAASAPVARAQAHADSARASRGVHYVFLVRHGMYDRDDNADDRTGNALNALGHEQARLLGARLAAMGIRFHSLVTSDFTRARQTAEDIGAAIHMAPAVDTLIHECTPTREHPEYSTYHSADDIAGCVSQLEAAYAKYFRPSPAADTWDVLVCHGNVIRWLTLKSLGADVRRWYVPDIGNASLTVLAVRPDGSIRLVTFSDTGHLPLEKQTWAGRGMGAGQVSRGRMR